MRWKNCEKTPDGFIDLMFAGNIGKAQSIDTVIRAASLTKDIENLRWHIVGDGSELENCKRLATELETENVIFHGRKPLEEMPKYYAMADAMLVTLYKNDIISKTLPGKVQTYMAAGKPIIGAIDGEAALVINESRCGLCGEAENAEKLAENVREFMTKDVQEFKKNAIEYSRANFDKEAFFSKLESVMSK